MPSAPPPSKGPPRFPMGPMPRPLTPPRLCGKTCARTPSPRLSSCSAPRPSPPCAANSAFPHWLGRGRSRKEGGPPASSALKVGRLSTSLVLKVGRLSARQSLKAATPSMRTTSGSPISRGFSCSATGSARGKLRRPFPRLGRAGAWARSSKTGALSFRSFPRRFPGICKSLDLRRNLGRHPNLRPRRSQFRRLRSAVRLRRSLFRLLRLTVRLRLIAFRRLRFIARLLWTLSDATTSSSPPTGASWWARFRARTTSCPSGEPRGRSRRWLPTAQASGCSTSEPAADTTPFSPPCAVRR